jgi:UTP--glucose-1-phosphate uridylyltransferase
MDRRSTVLPGMISTYEQYGRSVVALREFPIEEMSSYGCVKPEPMPTSWCSVLDIVSRRRAPSNLAVMGRYIFTPRSSTPSKGCRRGSAARSS